MGKKKHKGHFMGQYHKRLVAVFAFGPDSKTRSRNGRVYNVDVEGFVPTSGQFTPLSWTSCRVSDSRSQWAEPISSEAWWRRTAPELWQKDSLQHSLPLSHQVSRIQQLLSPLPSRILDRLIIYCNLALITLCVSSCHGCGVNPHCNARGRRVNDRLIIPESVRCFINQVWDFHLMKLGAESNLSYVFMS